jgi:hypothetical protein
MPRHLGRLDGLLGISDLLTAIGTGAVGPDAIGVVEAIARLTPRHGSGAANCEDGHIVVDRAIGEVTSRFEQGLAKHIRGDGGVPLE